MFIRMKKLKGTDYAYLVKNTWTKDGPRQKTKKYLGKCITLEKVNEERFSKHHDIESYIHGNSLRKVLGALMRTELLKHGFKPYKKSLAKETKDDTIIGRGIRIYSKESKKDIVLRINEGYMCEYNLKKILSFTFKGEDEFDKRKEAERLAELFVTAGFSLEKEVFVEVYRKIARE